MDVTRLPLNQRAPELEDRVTVYADNPPRFRWGGTVAYRREAVFIEAPDIYPTSQAAEHQALVWAEHHSSEMLFLETIDDGPR